MALPDVEIGESAFEGCTSMKEFYTGNGVATLGKNSLKGMTSLENLTLGTQLVEMSGCGIEDSQSLKRINCLSKYAPFADEFSDAVYGQASLYVPEGAEKEYGSRNPWNKFHNIVGYDFSGVEDVAAEEGIGFSVCGGVLTVNGVDGAMLEIYDMSGRLVHACVEPTVSGLSRGFYLLKAGNRTAKIRI